MRLGFMGVLGFSGSELRVVGCRPRVPRRGAAVRGSCSRFAARARLRPMWCELERGRFDGLCTGNDQTLKGKANRENGTRGVRTGRAGASGLLTWAEAAVDAEDVRARLLPHQCVEHVLGEPVWRVLRASERLSARACGACLYACAWVRARVLGCARVSLWDYVWACVWVSVRAE